MNSKRVSSLDLLSHNAFAANVAKPSVSYAIWTDAGMIYAENGVTGAIDFSGAEAAVVIQDTIDSLRSGGRVLIKAGIYTISTTITPTVSNIELCGEGTGTLLTLASDVNSPVVYLYSLSNWCIHDLMIDGNKACQSALQDANAQSCDGIRIGTGNSPATTANIVVERCWIQNCRCYGINAHGGDNHTGFKVMIKSCYIFNCDANGILMSDVKGAAITNCIVDRASDIGISAYNAHNYFIADNTVVNVSSDTSPWPSHNGHRGIVLEGTRGDRVTIVRNHIHNCTGNGGIAVDPTAACTDVAIRGNRVYSCGDGIDVSRVDGCLIQGNAVERSSRNGIRINALMTETQVIGNRISDTGSQGIYNNADNTQITGNYVRSTANHAIYSNAHTMLIISGNVINTTTGVGHDGINLDGACSFCLIAGNMILSVARDGIHFSGDNATGNFIAWNMIVSLGENGIHISGAGSVCNEIVCNTINGVGSSVVLIALLAFLDLTGPTYGSRKHILTGLGTNWLSYVVFLVILFSLIVAFRMLQDNTPASCKIKRSVSILPPRQKPI